MHLILLRDSTDVRWEKLSGRPHAVELPAGVTRVFALDLSLDGEATLINARRIESAEISHRVLSLTTSTNDGQFGLFPRGSTRLEAPLWLKVEMSNSTIGAKGKAYWSSGGPFSEENSASWHLPGDGRVYPYVVALDADQPITYIRFDPSDQKDTVQIRLIELYS